MENKLQEQIDRMKKLSGIISEDVTNKGSEASLRLVDVNYSGKQMKAVAIGYASGPYFKEVYYLLDGTKFENSDFDSVQEIDPTSLIH